MNPEFLEGRKTRDEILQDFLNNFDGARGNNDGVVTRQEWDDYYAAVSANIDNDNHFIQLMRNAWKLDQ